MVADNIPVFSREDLAERRKKKRKWNRFSEQQQQQQWNKQLFGVNFWTCVTHKKMIMMISLALQNRTINLVSNAWKQNGLISDSQRWSAKKMSSCIRLYFIFLLFAYFIRKKKFESEHLIVGTKILLLMSSILITWYTIILCELFEYH